MSFPKVKIKVDGQHGVEARGYSTSQELVRASGNFHGTDALPAENGRNGGSIRVELQIRPGGGFVAFDPDTAESRHVSIGKDLFLSARGGDGEDGGTGGNGKTGSRGYSGQDATQYSDATRGGDGGPGGNGGQGSSGGHGGHGGTVEVRVSKHDMHLAYAVGWSVSGGTGGRADCHGRAGEGGAGGRGGSGCSWKEFDGYRQVCASDCTHGSSFNGTSSAVTRSGNSSIGSLRSGVPLYLAIQNGAISDGQNTYALNNIGARIPASHAGLIREALGNAGNDQALVHSSSSGALVPGGHSSGCREVPKYKTYSKPAARKGADGPRGWAPKSHLHSGNPGNSGHGSFVVFDPYDSLADQTYTSPFEFRLVDFDVADENNDGIFEPGECALISTLQIENANTSSSGMPTPHTQIPATLRSCAWLNTVQGRDKVSLPCNIAPRQTKTTTRETIWAKIESPPASSIANQIFIAHQQVHLDATIPDIDRPVNNFNHSRAITIRYPLFLEPNQIKCLESIPFGSSCSIKWPVSNCSSQALGSSSSSTRQVHSSIKTRSQFAILGDLLVPIASTRNAMAEEIIPRIGAYQTQEISKRLHILEYAEEYSKIDFLIQLHATPVTTQTGQGRSSTALIPMQTHKITVQVTNRYHHNPDSKFLLLTSKSTTKEYLDGWRQFIRTELHTSVDVWNVSQHRGVREQDSTTPVLDKYAGKTIVALDDPFQFQNAGQRTALDFVDAESSFALSRKQTSFIFAKQGRVPKQGVMAKLSEIAWAAAKLGTVDGNLHSVATHTSTRKELLDVLGNGTSNLEAYTLDYAGDLERYGRRLARRLRRLHPRDRFILTDNMDGSGLVILQCNPQGQKFSVACVGQGRDSSSTVSGLSLSEAYNLVSNLPFNQRLDILQEKALSRNTYSNFVLLAAKHSVLHDLHSQVSCLASRPRWSHTPMNFDRSSFTTNSLIGDCHDKVAMLLSHDLCRPVRDNALSETALELLTSVIMSARCQSFPQLLTKIFSPFRRTRSHVKRGLLVQVKELMKSRNALGDTAQAVQSKDYFKAFRKRVGQKLTKKDHGKTISQRISTLTKGQIRPSNSSKSTHAITVDSVFPKTQYVSPQELNNWQHHHHLAEAQHRNDREIIANLGNDLNLEVHDESRPDPSEIACPAPIRPPGPPDVGVEEQVATEVAAAPVSAPLELHTRAAPTPTPANILVNDAGRVDGVRDTPQPSSELMATSLAPEPPQHPLESRSELASRSIVPELPQTTLQQLLELMATWLMPELAAGVRHPPPELMSTSPMPELSANTNPIYELSGQASLNSTLVTPTVNGPVRDAGANSAFTAMLLRSFEEVIRANAAAQIPVEDVDW